MAGPGRGNNKMEEQNKNLEEIPPSQKESSWKWIAAGAIIVLVVTQIYYLGLNSQKSKSGGDPDRAGVVLNSESGVLPASGIELPIKWNDMGKRLAGSGVIDVEAFESLYSARGGLSPEEKKLLLGLTSGKIVMTERNSSYWLNLLWAFGLANKNSILEKGPMVNYDGKVGSSAEALAKAGRFASTGGWTLAKGDPMDHYSKHEMIKLTPEQQALVESVSKNVYRPCCGNSTHFPDCNHGMAMLGLLELMAANGASESEMYKVALKVNSYWFPDTYLTIDQYLKMKGMSLATADPKEVLGKDYSSAYGYANILSQVQTPEKKSSGGGGCGV
ncbi:MAG: Uncharacterized protein G01um101420_867 [Parcubacteria group bacterium Gr01-1014_20]|nr:MAG: Uncharacterized protein G01um101420_867 [Parcubacteria group bacterium Gr01-1014_20]